MNQVQLSIIFYANRYLIRSAIKRLNPMLSYNKFLIEHAFLELLRVPSHSSDLLITEIYNRKLLVLYIPDHVVYLLKVITDYFEHLVSLQNFPLIHYSLYKAPLPTLYLIIASNFPDLREHSSAFFIVKSLTY